MDDPGNLTRMIIAASVISGSLLVGVTLKLLLGRLTRRTKNTASAWDDLLVRLLHDVSVVLCLSGGVWVAMPILRLDAVLTGHATRVLAALVILTVTFAGARLAAGIVSSVALSRSGVAQSVTLFANITRSVVLVIGFLVMLQSAGVSITPLLTALGVGGLAVALALQDTLANLFAGVHILASKTVQPGDFVRLSTGQEGYITDINWRKTTIRMLSDNLVIVPNARFADATITNFQEPGPDMSLIVQAKVGYDSDLGHVEKVVTEVGAEVMREVEGGVPDYEPLVRFHTFDESSINFSVILRTREFGDQFVVKHEFIKRLHHRFQVEEISIPLPTRNLVFAASAGAQQPPAGGVGGVLQ